MSALQDFENEFGKACLDETINRTGRHVDSFASRTKIPSDPELRLMFSLMEMLDFECCHYGDAPEGLTSESIEAFLKEHVETALKIPEPPSYIGLLSGRFNFLKEGIEK